MDKNIQKKTSDNPNIPQEPTHKFQLNQFNLNNQQLQQQQQQKQQQQQQFIQFSQQQKQPNIIQLNNNHSSSVSGQEEIENQIVQKVDSKEIVRELLEDVSKIKKIKHQDFVELNKYVDAFDKEESWRVAKIVQFYKDQTFTVRFDGWKDTWNEDYKFNDEKIQPVRKNTVGYTGAINSSHRMFEFSNQEQNIKNAIEQMDLLNNEEFLNLEASKINQWLRTELFIIGDAILSSSNIKENEYTLSIEFFDTFLRMSTRYLRILPSLIPYYIEGNNIDKSLHVVNAKVALAHAFNEICDLVYIIFSKKRNYKRINKIYVQNEFPLKEHSRTYCVKLKEFNNKSYNLIINFMNYFGNLDGFEDAINLIKVKIETNNPNVNYRIPLKMLASLLMILLTCINFMITNKRETFTKQILESICSRLSNLSAKEVKDLEFHETLNIIRSLQNHQIFKDCENYIIKLEILEFNVLWDVIQNSSNLEKKIKAIQELNDFISRTQPNYVQNIQQKVDFIDQTIDYNKYKLNVLDKVQLQQLIKEKRVIEYLLHDNFHPEIFKKSIDIINIMNDAENGFPDYYLNLLWEVSQNKHEADLRIIYEIYCQLAQNMNLSNLEFLYSKIQAIPDEKVDEITIQLLTNFSVEAMKSVSNTSEQNGFASFFTKWKKTSNSKQYEFFGLSRLYNLTQDSSKLPQQYVTKAITSFCSLFQNYKTFLSEREKYLGFCLKNLENNISQSQSLVISKVILKSYGRNQILQKPNTSTTESMVQKINKEKNLVDLVVNSMKKYQIDIQKNQKFQEYLLKGEEELDPKIEIFSGKINHRDNIFNRLDFLEFIFCYQKQNYQINLQQFEVLWDVLITEKAVLNYDKQMFLEWLPNINQEMEKNINDTTINFNLHMRVAKEVFENIFLNWKKMEKYQTINLDIFKCIQKVFYNINFENKSLIRTNKGLIKVKKFENIEGAKFFWNILYYCPNQEVIDQATKIVVDIHNRPTHDTANREVVKLQMWENFYNSCISVFQQQNFNMRAKQNIIATFKHFLIEIEGRQTINQYKNQNQIISLNVALKNDMKKQRQFNIPGDHSLLFLRKQINNEFKLKNNDFDMILPADGYIIKRDQEEEFTVIAIDNVKQKDNPIDLFVDLKSRKNPDYQTIQNFKQKISNNDQFSQILFDLLQSAEQEPFFFCISDILKILPFKQDLKKAIFNCEVVQFQPKNQNQNQNQAQILNDWSKVLPQNCYRKLLYCLQIIQGEILVNSDKKQIWVENFSQKQGVQHLYNIFMNIEQNSFEQLFNIQCFGLMGKILADFMHMDKKKLFKFYQGEELWEKIMFTAIQYLKNVLDIQEILFSSRPHLSDEDISQIRQSFFQGIFQLLQTIFRIDAQYIRIFMNHKEIKSILMMSLLEMSDENCRLKVIDFFLQELDQEQSKINVLPIYKEKISELKEKDSQYQKLQQAIQQYEEFVQNRPSYYLLKYFIEDFLPLIPTNTKYQKQCKEFFMLVNYMLSARNLTKNDQKNIEEQKIIDFSNFLNDLINIVMQSPVQEFNEEDQDFLLQGALDSINKIININHNFKLAVLKNQQFHKFLLHKCLFELSSKSIQLQDEQQLLLQISQKKQSSSQSFGGENQNQGLNSTSDQSTQIMTVSDPKSIKVGSIYPKAKNYETRKSALNLLVSLLVQNQKTSNQQGNKQELEVYNPSQETYEFLRQFLVNGNWRTKSQNDWSVITYLQRHKSGYVGLRNLGCTCYMNSLFQQIFMIREFSDALVSVNPNLENVKLNENVLYNTQLILGALKFSQKQYYDPRYFCQAFKNFDGSPIDVLQQMDVDEFFNTLFDKLENNLKLYKNDFIIKETFGGVLSNELICKGCPHQSEREEPSLAISVQVKNKSSLQEGLQAYVEGEMLQGENAYYCEKCDKKVNTLKRQSIKKLPNVLIIVLKRFEFDFEEMRKLKVNDYCEFPQKLDMTQYTQAYLHEQDLKESDNNQEQEETNQEKIKKIKFMDKSYYQFNLSGIVIHQGNSDSGHYYSLIKENQQWFELNDKIVRNFDESEIPNVCFGGQEKISDNEFDKGMVQKNRNAYLLFYKRDVLYDEMGQQKSQLISTQRLNNLSDQIQQEVIQDNMRYRINNYFFSNNFQEFQENLVNNIEDQKSYEFNLPEQKLFITYFFTVVVRRQGRQDRIPIFYPKIKNILQNNSKIAQWLVRNFCDDKLLQEFLIDCPIKDMQYLCTGILILAIQSTIKLEQNMEYDMFKQQSVVVKLLSIMIYMIHDTKYQGQNMERIYRIIFMCNRININLKIFLLKNQMIGRIVQIMQHKNPQGPGYEQIEYYWNFGKLKEKSDLGEPNFQSDNNKCSIKAYEEMLEEKKQQKMQEKTVISYNYLIATLSDLVRSVNFDDKPDKQPKQFSSTQINYVVDQQDIDFLKENLLVMNTLFRQSTEKISRNKLGQMMAYLSSDKQFYSTLMLYIEEMLTDKQNIVIDDEDLRPYMVVLYRLAQIQDSNQKDRNNEIATVILKFLVKNTKFIQPNQIVFQYLLKFYDKIPAFRENLVQLILTNKEMVISTFYRWIEEISNPIQFVNQNKGRIYKDPSRKFIQLYQSITDQQLSKLRILALERQEQFKKMMKNQDLALQYDFDEDFSQQNLQIGTKIDYKFDEYKGWGSFEIIDSIDSMYHIKGIDQNNSQLKKWVYFDDQFIAPYETAKIQLKNQFDYFK